MAEVLDVVNRFTYQIEDTELQQASQAIQRQVQSLVVMGQRVQNLQNTFDRTANSEIQKRNRISALIQKQRREIDQTTQAIGKQVTQNKKLQDAIVKEVGLINTLNSKLKALKEARDAAFSQKEIQSFNRQISATQNQISKLTNTSKGGIFRGAGSSILQGIGLGTGIGLVTQGIGAIKSLISESIQLAIEAEGVERAFNRIDQPDLLNNLKTSVKGTVSDLELMKKAVEFQNFGLPVEKLGIALDFARQRANDTGQSVDYLVNSIVTGIGRQSPLILDNLGINAKRVSDRFKETGDFAEAAFGIIQEEAAKAGDAVDTVGDKIAMQNAKIANFQAKIGVYFTNVYSKLIDEWANIGDAFAKDFRDIGLIQEEAEEDRVDNLDRFFNTYKSTDLLGRQAIENQATDSYNNLIRKQQEFFNIGLFSTGEALQGQLDKYKDFFSKLRNLNQDQGKDVTFQNFTQADLLGLTRDELKELRTDGETALNPLAAGDKKGIAAVNNRIKLIDQALGRFRLTIKKTKSETVKNKINTRDLIAQTPEQWELEINKITKSISKLKKLFDSPNTQSGIVSDTAPSGEFDSDELDYLTRQAKERDENAQDQKANDKQILDDRKQAYKDAYSDIRNTVITTFQQIYDARLTLLNLEIEAQRDRYNQARLLAENGNTEQFDIEAKRLNDLQKERERIAKQQIQLNALLQASNAAVALTEAIGAVVSAASKGDPYTIAARVAAAVASLVAGVASLKSAFSSDAQGFKDGVVDLEGEGTGTSDSIPAKLSRGESVITAEATKKNKDVLSAINNGAVFSMPNTKTVNNAYHGTTIDTVGILKELKAVRQAVADSGVKVNQSMDGNGIHQTVEKFKRRDRANFS